MRNKAIVSILVSIGLLSLTGCEKESTTTTNKPNNSTPQQGSTATRSEIDNYLFQRARSVKDANAEYKSQEYTFDWSNEVKTIYFKIHINFPDLRVNIESIHHLFSTGENFENRLHRDGIYRISFQLDQTEIIERAFEKYLEWDRVALEKKPAYSVHRLIVKCLDDPNKPSGRTNYIYYNWNLYGDGKSELTTDWNYDSIEIDSDDVRQYQKLLNQLPELKKRLADKIRNTPPAPTENELFK